MISIYPNPGIHTSVSYPFKPVDIRRFSDVEKWVTRYTWSPIIFNNNLRQEVNFKVSRLISLDFDNTKEQVMTLSQAVDNVFAGMQHIIGTTKNHQLPKVTEKVTYPPADRFRVILVLPKKVATFDAYQYTFNKSIAYYNSDSQAAGLSRLFHPCREIVSISDGDYEDFYQESPEEIRKRLAQEEIRRREAAAYYKLGKLPPYVAHILKKKHCVGRNSTLYPVIAHYAQLGMPAEGIMDIIKTSNIYKDNENDREFMLDIGRSIKSAAKRLGVK